MQDKALSMLGLAEKAPKVVSGEFSVEKAVLFQYGGEAPLPEEITVLEEVTAQPAYKNRALAASQKL